MKESAKSNNRKVFCLLALAGLVATVTLPAHAIDPPLVQRTLNNKLLTGPCCFNFVSVPPVGVNEPAALVPVAVTFSMDYLSTSGAGFFLGLNVNGTGCKYYGAREAPTVRVFTPAAYQWVIFPQDGVLVPGPNIFQLCGGASSG